MTGRMRVMDASECLFRVEPPDLFSLEYVYDANGATRALTPSRPRDPRGARNFVFRRVGCDKGRMLCEAGSASPLLDCALECASKFGFYGDGRSNGHGSVSGGSGAD